MKDAALEVCLITGASRGIGKEIALKLASPKRLLLLSGRDLSALENVQAGVSKKGGEAELFPADLSTPEGVTALQEQLKDRCINVLVNNAGIARVAPLDKLSLKDWQETFNVNVTAPFLLTKNFVPGMPKGGSVINILSVASHTGFPDWSAYCMSKFALDGFSQAIREELRPRGIRVINIYPAATDTGIWNDLPGNWPRERMMAAADVAEAVLYALNAPRSVLVENITLGGMSGRI